MIGLKRNAAMTEGEMEDLMEKARVAELVQTERAARDQGQWARMSACYHPDSRVSISWVEATGPEFVAMSEQAFAAGVRHLHVMSPTLVTLNGDKALAETGCVILLNGLIGDTPVTVSSHARLFVRAERGEAGWRIRQLGAVYFQDAAAPQIPGAPIVLDEARLGRYRPSYRFLSYVLEEAGKTPRPDRAGVDRPDLIEALHKADEAWLIGEL
jgi:hypothetical protein